MGECGCADGFGDFKIRTPNGWYVLTLYPGCTDCDTPIGLKLEWFSDTDEQIRNVIPIPDIGDCLKDNEVFLPIFDIHDLVNSEELKEMESPEEYETAKDFVTDMRDAIRQSAITTMDKTLKNNCKF